MSWRPCKLSHLVSWMSENDASGENTNGAISSVDLSSCLLVQSEHHAVSHSTSMSRLTSKHLAVHYLLIMQKSQVCYYTNGLQRHGHKGNCFWTIYRGHGYSPEPIYLYVYLLICLSICLSLYLSVSLSSPSFCLSIFLSICKLENEAILRDVLKFWTWQHQKTQLFCETSSIFELDNVKNEAILQDFLQTWTVEIRADGFVPMRFAIFPLHLSKVLRLPRKSDARSYEVLHLSRKSS